MTLDEYQEKFQLSNEQFAVLLEISYSTLGHYKGGRRIPRTDIAVRIEMKTNGLVTLKDIMKNIKNNQELEEEICLNISP